jgi:hypothetical protein
MQLPLGQRLMTQGQQTERRGQDWNTPRKHGKFAVFRRRRCKFRCSCRRSRVGRRSGPNRRGLAPAFHAHSTGHAGAAGLRSVRLARVIPAAPSDQPIIRPMRRKATMTRSVTRPWPSISPVLWRRSQ